MITAAKVGIVSQQLDHAGVFRNASRIGAQDGGGDVDSVLHTDDEQDSQFDHPNRSSVF